MKVEGFSVINFKIFKDREKGTDSLLALKTRAGHQNKETIGNTRCKTQSALTSRPVIIIIYHLNKKIKIDTRTLICLKKFDNIELE